jgi:small subunit ribosomal protein S21
MVSVKRERNDSDEKMIKRFLKRVKKFGIIEEILRRRYYVKPSVQKRLDKERSIAEHKKRIAKENR